MTIALNLLVGVAVVDGWLGLAGLIICEIESIEASGADVDLVSAAVFTAVLNLSLVAVVVQNVIVISAGGAAERVEVVVGTSFDFPNAFLVTEIGYQFPVWKTSEAVIRLGLVNVAVFQEHSSLGAGL